MTCVLIVDDKPAFRRQLRPLLHRAGLAVVGEAGDIPEAEPLVEALQPDLAAVDVRLPGVNRLEGTSRLRAQASGLRVILVSAFRDRAAVFRAAAEGAGAEAFIARDELDLEVVWAWKGPCTAVATVAVQE
jgi:DNA-binding NarL/FixJ family response regulator